MNDIKAILTELRPEFDYDESDNFIEDCYLDSYDIITLVSIIEEKYGVIVDGLDIIPENFVSYEAILNLIKKSGGKA